MRRWCESATPTRPASCACSACSAEAAARHCADHAEPLGRGLGQRLRRQARQPVHGATSPGGSPRPPRSTGRTRRGDRRPPARRRRLDQPRRRPARVLRAVPTRRREDLQRAAAASICVNTEQPGTSWFRPRGRRVPARPADARHQRPGRRRASRRRAWRPNGCASAACRRCRRHRADAPIGRSTCCSWVASTTAAVRRSPSSRRTCGTLHADLRLVGGRSAHRRGDSPGGVRCRQVPPAVVGRRCCSTSTATARRRAGAAHPPYFEWARAVEAMANGCVVDHRAVARAASRCVAGDALRRGRRSTSMATRSTTLLHDAAPPRRDRRRARAIDVRRARRSSTRSRRCSTGSRQTCCRDIAAHSQLVGRRKAPWRLGRRRVRRRVRARRVPAVPAHAGRRRSASPWPRPPRCSARCRGVRVAPRQPPAHRALRDAGVRGRRPGGQRRRLAVQLRGRRHRDVGQHRRQRGRAASS